MSNQTLNLTETTYRYFQAHACREPAILAKLRAETARQFPEAVQMQISPEQGQFMHLLLTVMHARRVLEIGTSTGYSTLWMAQALPADGKLITCDINAATTQLARDFWCQAGCEEKIELKLGPAADSLQALLTQGAANSFDFAFIDADKTGYDVYYEQCLQLVRPGGVIAIDNTLQRGRVADPDNQNPNTLALRQLNDKLLRDSRIMLSMLPLSDGVTLAVRQ